MTRPYRDELWMVDFGEPVGHEQGCRRPAVVVSADRLNGSRAGLVIVVPITTTRRQLPSHVEIDSPGTGLRAVSYAKAEDIKSVSVERLVRRLGAVPPDVSRRLSRVIKLLLDLD